MPHFLSSTAMRALPLVVLAAVQALQADRPSKPRDRPDLRQAWRLRYHGGPASAAYLDFKVEQAALELARMRAPSRRAASLPVWQEIGPMAGRTGYPLVSTEINDSGRTTAILSPPTKPSVLYVAYSGGGVWKCSNAQLDAKEDWVWRSITDTLPASSASGNIAVGALALEPGSAETLYLALGDAFDAEGRGFYISTNGGESWTVGGTLGTATRSYAIHPLGGGVLLVGTNAGLFRSEDSGKTFVPVTLPNQPTSQVWSIAGMGGDDLACAALSGNTGSLWFSSDRGRSWNRATLDASATAKAPRRIALGTSPAAPGQAWGTFNSGGRVAKGLLHTADKGRTWTYLDGTSKGLLSDSNYQGFYNLAIAVDPQDAKRIFLGADNSVWRTLDGGTTWARMTDAYHQVYQYAHADVHCTAWVLSETPALIFGTDGGFTLFRDPFRAVIPKSTSSGAPNPDRTFADSRRNVGIGTQLIYNLGCTVATMPPDSRFRVVTGHQDNGSRVRVGQGDGLGISKAFDETAPTGDGFASLIHPKNGNLMLTSSYGTDILKSTAGGTEDSWNPASDGISGVGPFKTVLVHGHADPTGNTVYTFTDRVYKSINFGDSWTPLGITGYNGGIDHLNASPSDDRVLAVVGGDSGALTTNGGTSWVTFGPFPTPVAASYVAFDPINPQTLYVASALNSATASHLFRSTNGGTSWTALDDPSTGFPYGIPVHVVQAAPWNAQELYAGTDFGLYVSHNGGLRWERLGQGLPLVATTDLYLAPDRSFIRIATFGRGVWEINPTVQQVSITLTPSVAKVGVRGTVRFSATVAGTPDTRVTWRVTSPNGGSITADGLYTAPATPGTYTVAVTSVADTDQTASASVTVLPSHDLNGDGVIDLRDLLVLGQYFGTTSPLADLNGDGRVDDADLALLELDL